MITFLTKRKEKEKKVLMTAYIFIIPIIMTYVYLTCLIVTLSVG